MTSSPTLEANRFGIVPKRSIVRYALPMHDTPDIRPTAKIFLSWAVEDERLKTAFVGLLEPHLVTLAHLRVEWWESSQLRAGEEWRREILARLGEADAVVLLTSPEFFASTFIREEELPACIGAAAPTMGLPASLKPVPIDRDRPLRRLHGVEDHQIFRLSGRAFSELRGPGRDRFALEFANQLQDRITRRSPWRAM